MKLNALKPYFPHAFKSNSVKSLIIGLLIYAVIAAVANIVFGLLDNIWIIGFIFSVIGWVVDIYCVAGVILAILVFLKVVQ